MKRWNQRIDKALRLSAFAYSVCSWSCWVGESTYEVKESSSMSLAFHTYNQPDIQDGPFPTPCFILKHNQQDHKMSRAHARKRVKTGWSDIGEYSARAKGKVAQLYPFDAVIMLRVARHECETHSTNCPTVYPPRVFLGNRNPVQ